MKVNKDFWNKKKVLITGHTGFKGSWLSLWLDKLGSSVSGISLKPDTVPNLFSLTKIRQKINNYFCNIKNYEKLNDIVNEINPEIVFHLAAQPIVIDSYKNPLNTFHTNFLGTLNLLNSLRNSNVKVIVIVTSDKVYKLSRKIESYTEKSEIGGLDPYSASKSVKELLVNCYRFSYYENKINISTVRAGNVLGGGDWQNHRLIPDIIRSWQSKNELIIRNPKSVRPWQHVLDTLKGYIILAEKKWYDKSLYGAFNFGPHKVEDTNVLEIVSTITKKLKIDHYKIKETNEFKETPLLFLNTDKTFEKLNFKNRWDINLTIEKTVNWYKSFYEGESPNNLCLADIEDYEQNE